MADPRITVQVQDQVAIVKMDDGKANAIQGAWLDEMDAALDRIESEGAKAVVLTGRSGFFCGGLDLKTLPTLPADDLREVLRRFCATILRVFTFSRPVVAAIGGHAVAGGIVLGLACDRRLMAKGPFKVGLNEVAIGLPPPAFVVELARAALPPSRLLPAVAHGVMSTGQDVLEHGWVDEVVQPEALMDRATEQATALSRLDPAAYHHAKTLLREPFARGVQERFEGEIEAFMNKIGKS